MSHRLRIRGKKVTPRDYPCPVGMIKDPDYPGSGTPCILAPTERGTHSRYPVNTPYADMQPNTPSRLYGHEHEGTEYNFPARGLTRIEPAGYEGREYGRFPRYLTKKSKKIWRRQRPRFIRTGTSARLKTCIQKCAGLGDAERKKCIDACRKDVVR